MNICFVNSTRKWGGVKSWTLDVARGLTKCGHRICIVGRPGPFINKAQTWGLDALGLSFGPDFNPLCIAHLLNFFTTRRIERVIVNVGKDMRSAGVAAKLLGIPVIHRVGLAGDMLDTWKVRLLHRWVRPRILVPCAYIKAGLLRELPYLDPDEISIILTGKEPASTPSTRVYTPLRFISTSQLNADKGHVDALIALAALKDQGFAFAYHIVGTGRIEAELKSQAIRLGLDDRIVWHGFQHDVRAMLRQADVFLLPSHREGLPNALLEAMAEGLVCVARNVGGVSEAWPAAASSLLLPTAATSNDFKNILMDLLQRPEQDILVMGRFFWDIVTTNTLLDMTRQVETFMLHAGHPQ